MLKQLFLTGLVLTVLFTFQSHAGQVNAFIYHRFDESRYPSTNISAEIFSQQLQYTQEKNLRVISLGEVASRLIAGDKLPAHAISFCVDDAFRSFYDVGMPILRRYGYPVTLFVNTDSVGTFGYLGWEELADLAFEGVEIGNHTASHAYLIELRPEETPQQWEARIRSDIEKAQQQFEKHLGFRPELFAYPYGEYSAAVIEIIRDLGFQVAFSQQSGVIFSGQNRFTLPRFPMGGPFATLAGFKAKLAMRPLPVAVEEPFDPVIHTNPPVLRVLIPDKQIAQKFNCFVQGNNRCWVEADEAAGPGWYRVQAEQPLTGRRNKYTLTLQSRQGAWLWYSHLWVNAKKTVEGE